MVEYAKIQIKEIFIIELFLKNPNKILIFRLIFRLSDSPELSSRYFMSASYSKILEIKSEENLWSKILKLSVWLFFYKSIIFSKVLDNNSEFIKICQKSSQNNFKTFCIFYEFNSFLQELSIRRHPDWE